MRSRSCSFPLRFGRQIECAVRIREHRLRDARAIVREAHHDALQRVALGIPYRPGKGTGGRRPRHQSDDNRQSAAHE